jgi:hypothetical protein
MAELLLTQCKSRSELSLPHSGSKQSDKKARSVAHLSLRQTQTKNRNKNSTFQSDMLAGRRILFFCNVRMRATTHRLDSLYHPIYGNCLCMQFWSPQGGREPKYGNK